MSVSTTLSLSRVSSFDEKPLPQKTQYSYQNCGNSFSNHNHINNNNNNNITTSASYSYHFPSESHHTDFSLSYSKTEPIALTLEDALIAERYNESQAVSYNAITAATGPLLQKSNSYNGITVKPKATILKHDSLNGRINTSLTDSDSEYGSAIGSGGGLMAMGTIPLLKATPSSSPCANDACEEHDSFLVSNGAAATMIATETSTSANATNRRPTRSSSSKKNRSSICYRANAFISRNWYLSYLVPLSLLLALMFVAYLTRDYAKRLLFWIETQNPWVIFAIFMLLFVIVSFPVVVGYFVLMITAGYLFGLIRGFLTVILGANVGIAIAHLTLRSLRHRLPVQKFIKNETGRAILRVISGPRAFRVVLFTRLTPIPFGIQNAIFGVSTINPKVYHTATFLGLLPAQLINVYLGSTLRSMHEVLNNHGTAITGYISFGVEVVCGIALMFWVVQKARKELSETLLTDIENDGKLIDIQV